MDSLAKLLMETPSLSVRTNKGKAKPFEVVLAGEGADQVEVIKAFRDSGKAEVFMHEWRYEEMAARAREWFEAKIREYP